MVFKSNFEGQNPNEAHRLNREVSEDTFLKVQAMALETVFRDNPKEWVPWLSDTVNADFSRETVTEYLETHENIDIDELAELIKQRVDETQILH